MAQLTPIQRLLDLGVRALGAVPHGLGLQASSIVGRAGFRLYGAQRRQVLWNLAQCFGHRPQEWRLRTAKSYFEHLVTSAYEVFVAVQNPDEMRSLIRIENGERLTAALEKGRGVVAVAGHGGNYTLLPFVLQSSSAEPAFIARVPPERAGPIVAAATDYYRQLLKPMSGLRVLPSSRSGMREAVRLLGEGNLVLVFADLTWGMGEMPVRFLGVNHHVSRAPASLALRTGAVLLPIFTRRRENGRHRVMIQEPLIPPAGGTPRTAAERSLMDQFTRQMEACVEQAPEQWYWLHRGWLPADARPSP